MAELGIQFIPEPFHPNCCNWGFLGNYHSIAQEALGLSDNSLSPNSLRDKATVFKLFAYLHQSPKEFVVEIFPEHLAIDVISQLVSLYPVIILQRRLIDQYISLRKAYAVTSSGKWMGADTTSLKIPVDANSFCKYASSMKDFYLYVASSISARNSLVSMVVDYEYFSCFGDAYQVELVSTLLQQVGLAVSPISEAPDPAADLHGIVFPDKLTRQDLSSSWYQKVANPREFVYDLDRLSRLGLITPPSSISLSMRALSILDIVSLPFSIASTCCA